MRGTFRGIRWIAAKLALLAGLAGLILDLTVRDSHPRLAPFFYALPLPVSGGFLLIAAMLAGGRRRRRVIGCVALLALGWWFFTSYGWAWPHSGKWKAITWNMGHPKHPFQPFVALVRAERPDVMVLVESGRIGPAEAAAYERMLPGYRMVAAPNELSCLVRGEIRGASALALCDGGDMVHFRVKLGGRELNVFATDIEAEPFIPRKRQLDLLATMTRDRAHTIVMGDFNTPMESADLDGMRADFANAMDGPHRGFRETWFYCLPLLSLDQVWLSPDLEPLFVARRLTFASDHVPVVVTFQERR